MKLTILRKEPTEFLAKAQYKFVELGTVDLRDEDFEFYESTDDRERPVHGIIILNKVLLRILDEKDKSLRYECLARDIYDRHTMGVFLRYENPETREVEMAYRVRLPRVNIYDHAIWDEWGNQIGWRKLPDPPMGRYGCSWIAFTPPCKS